MDNGYQYGNHTIPRNKKTYKYKTTYKGPYHILGCKGKFTDEQNNRYNSYKLYEYLSY